MILEYLDTIIAFIVILLGVSLLITILNQMISALLGYRGTNLLWGIQTVLSTVEPNLATKAKQLATEILRQPIISDSIFSKFQDTPILGKLTKRWKLASAISPEELIRSLRNLAGTIRTTDAPTATLIDGMLKEVDPDTRRKVELIQNAAQGLSPGSTIQLDKIIEQLGTSVRGSIGKIEAYFDIAMKRTSQRFASQIRIWTIVFAVVIAFMAHLDSFNIFQKLWTNPVLRASLVSERDALLKEASIILSAQGGTAKSEGPGVPPQILADAMKKLIDKEKEATAGLSAVPRFNNLDEAMKWLRGGLKVDQRRKEGLVGGYKNLVLAELKAHADRIKEELAKAGFPLQIPTSLKDLIHFDWDWPSILGILVTAGFLSLGAPFWFNALKTLSNLRPLVANASAKTATGSTPS
jgi:hypothetical protein